MELPIVGTRPQCLGYYRLRKLGPLLFVAKYLDILFMAVPWKAYQVPTELFNIREYSNADVSWLLLAMFSKIFKRVMNSF